MTKRYSLLFSAALLLCTAAWCQADAAPEPAAPLAASASQDAGETTALPPELDLDTVKRIALRESPSLKAAEERVKQARYQVQQARAGYLPRLDVSVSGTNTWLSENDYRAARNAALAAPFTRFRTALSSSVLGGYTQPGLFSAASLAQSLYQGVRARAAVDDSVDTYDAQLTATWTLFDGFAREFSLAIARFGAKQSDAALQESRRLLLDALASSYYDVQLARENIAIAQADEAFNQRQLKEAEARRRVGTGSLSDVLNFQVRLNAAREELIRAQRVHATSRIALAALMGLPEGRLPDAVNLAPLPAEPLKDIGDLDGDTLVAYALEHRPDLLADQYAVKRQKANVGVQRSVRYPNVNAVASHAATSDGMDWSDEDFATTVGVTVSYNLFAGGRNRAKILEAKSQQREAEWGVSGLEISVVSEVNSALATLSAAEESLRLQRANAEYVRRNRDLVEKEYNAGQGSLVRLNEAQRDLTAAEANLASARVSAERALHALRTATAETLADLAP